MPQVLHIPASNSIGESLLADNPALSEPAIFSIKGDKGTGVMTDAGDIPVVTLGKEIAGLPGVGGMEDVALGGGLLVCDFKS